MTKAEKILRFIAAAGDKGRATHEIQAFIFGINHPGKDFYEKRPEKVYVVTARSGAAGELIERAMRINRGYYGTNLYGDGWGMNSGLLNMWCTKVGRGRWRIKTDRTIKAPFYVDPKRADHRLKQQLAEKSEFERGMQLWSKLEP